jgi:hypothetical protein
MWHMLIITHKTRIDPPTDLLEADLLEADLCVPQ